MFCSNCGKTIRPEDKECRHCGAFLGEDRFYGSTYTSSQVRVPVEELNQAPEGGMISYTRTNYMSFDNQPADDVYSNTTYRPLLSDEEDLVLQEAEEAAALQREQEEQAAAEAEAAAQAAAEEAAEEAPAEEAEEAPADEFEEAFEEEIPAEDVSAGEEEEEEYVPLTEEELDREYPLGPLKKAAISPRVLSYMEELDRRQQRKAEGGSGLRMPSFLKRKAVPVQNEVPEEELPEAEDIVAADYAADEEQAAYEAADAQESYEEAADDSAEYAEAEYAEEEYADAEELPAGETDEYAAEDEEAFGAEEYVADAEADDFEHYEDEDYADDEAEKPGFDFSGLIESAKGLLKNRTLQIAAAAVLIVAVITAGVIWLNFVTTKRAKIVDVTYSAYTEGISLLESHIGDDYRATMEQVYLTNTSYANETFAQDIAALNALMPAEPQANDELFVTTLTIIQDTIAEAIKADANAALNGSEADHAANSELVWQAIGNAVSQLSEATNPGELSVIVVSLEDIVAPAPTPTIAPTKAAYNTLTNGMNDSVEVKLMQNRLINLGYLEPDSDDGDFGNGTESAVKAFQRAAGLVADGIATPEVQAAMFADDAPRTGTALLNATETPAPEAGGVAPENPVTE